jgi:2-furoyl-CoA dehydrogenase FAD binding subunit
LDEKLNALAWRLGGYDDIHASARYRRELIRRAGATLIRETML